MSTLLEKIKRIYGKYMEKSQNRKMAKYVEPVNDTLRFFALDSAQKKKFIFTLRNEEKLADFLNTVDPHSHRTIFSNLDKDLQVDVLHALLKGAARMRVLTHQVAENAVTSYSELNEDVQILVLWDLSYPEIKKLMLTPVSKEGYPELFFASNQVKTYLIEGLKSFDLKDLMMHSAGKDLENNFFYLTDKQKFEVCKRMMYYTEVFSLFASKDDPKGIHNFRMMPYGKYRRPLKERLIRKSYQSPVPFKQKRYYKPAHTIA